MRPTAVAMLALLAFAAVVAQGERLYQEDAEDFPASVTQQRALLAASGAPGSYPPTYAGNTKASATIYLLIKPPAGKVLNARKYGLAHFNARIKRVLRKFNQKYKGAHLNFRATYISGPTFITGSAQAWLKYSFNVDLGPVGATYSAALRSEIRSALRKRSRYVKRTRGNIPRA